MILRKLHLSPNHDDDTNFVSNLVNFLKGSGLAYFISSREIRCFNYWPHVSYTDRPAKMNDYCREC